MGRVTIYFCFSKELGNFVCVNYLIIKHKYTRYFVTNKAFAKKNSNKVISYYFL